MKIVVDAFWDDDAKVWVASSREGIGLATEADTIELLQNKLAVLVPDLLGDDHEGPFEIELIAQSPNSRCLDINFCRPRFNRFLRDFY